MEVGGEGALYSSRHLERGKLLIPVLWLLSYLAQQAGLVSNCPPAAAFLLH